MATPTPPPGPALPQLPALPTAVITALTIAATVLGWLAPSLAAPWQEIDLAVIAVLAAVGIGGTRAALKAHRDAVFSAGVRSVQS